MELYDKSGVSPEDTSRRDRERLLDLGDPTTLAQLIARKYGIQEADAQDLCSEIFVEDLEKDLLGKKPENCNSWAWFWGAVANKFCNVCRGHVRRRNREIWAWRSDIDPADSPLDQTLEEETRKAVRACIAGLPDVYRKLIELRVDDQMTAAEIAARIESPLGTVRGKLYRACLRLRECLAGKSQGDS